MSLEEQLGRIADSLETIAKHASHLGRIVTVQASPAEKAEPAKKPADKKADAKKEEKAKGPSKEEVRKALQDVVAIDGKERAAEILAEHGGGAENLSKLKAEHYGAVLKACTS